MMKTNLLASALLAAAALSMSTSAAAPTDAALATVEAISAELSATELDAKVQAYIKENLNPILTNEVIVKAVTAQNEKGMTLDEIQKIDSEWSNAEEELPIHVELTTNACAKEIVKLVSNLSAVGEVFVMDNQGANVGQNALTSDYWQGDEAKWTESFNDGKGGISVGKQKLDKSSNRVEQQVSLPIVNSDGEVIGAVCFGLLIENI